MFSLQTPYGVSCPTSRAVCQGDNSFVKDLGFEPPSIIYRGSNKSPLHLSQLSLQCVAVVLSPISATKNSAWEFTKPALLHVVILRWCLVHSSEMDQLLRVIYHISSIKRLVVYIALGVLIISQFILVSSSNKDRE